MVNRGLYVKELLHRSCLAVEAKRPSKQLGQNNTALRGVSLSALPAATQRLGGRLSAVVFATHAGGPHTAAVLEQRGKKST